MSQIEQSPCNLQISTLWYYFVPNLGQTRRSNYSGVETPQLCRLPEPLSRNLLMAAGGFCPPRSFGRQIVTSSVDLLKDDFCGVETPRVYRIAGIAWPRTGIRVSACWYLCRAASVEAPCPIASHITHHSSRIPKDPGHSPLKCTQLGKLRYTS